jgi:hypothetical protein
MKRIIPLMIALVAATVLGQQAFSPSTQASTQPATSPLVQSTTSALHAIGPTSAPDRSRSRSEYSRSRRFEADTKPTSGPQGVVIPPPKPLSGDYAILTERSMFVKGVFRYAPPGENARRPYRPTTASTQSTSIESPESNLVLTGIVKQDNEYVAMVENYTNSQIYTLHSGEAIASGKIGPMTLSDTANYMDYIAGGRTTRVSVGRTLLNGDPPATRPFAAGSTVAADSTSPAGSSSGVGALAPPSDSLIERLKKKREAEMAGK